MESYKRLLLANRAWVEEKLSAQPEFFERLAEGQSPEFLWIGCSDSRVPPNEVTGLGPGDMFVHRNVANLVVHNDFNLLAVLQYAVEHLQVKHVIVCGHYGCGGVTAALGPQRFDLLDPWLRHIKDTYKAHQAEVDMHEAGPKRVNRMVELNVIQQVQNLVHTPIIQEAWKNLQQPTVHGWVFDLGTGLIRDLVKVDAGSEVESAYRYDV